MVWRSSCASVAYLWGIETSLRRCIVWIWRRSVAYLWGIETFANQQNIAIFKFWSVAYLWGIETNSKHLKSKLPIKSVAYLWGIETIATNTDLWGLFKSVAYLWGIETTHKYLFYHYPVFVCSVPMRDWNCTSLYRSCCVHNLRL